MVGDGAMQMNGLNELITVARYRTRWANPSFIVLVQLTEGADVDYAKLGRLTEYLGCEQLEFIRARQNRVLAGIPPMTRPYKGSDDIWFRYFTGDDVRSWAVLLLKHVQNVHARVEANR